MTNRQIRSFNEIGFFLNLRSLNSKHLKSFTRHIALLTAMNIHEYMHYSTVIVDHKQYVIFI